MKTRMSLVSNSSSSNFIVHYKDSFGIHNQKSTHLLTKEEVRLLRKRGFRISNVTHPSHLDSLDDAEMVYDKRLPSSAYYKCVSCNQDSEIYFLVKNKIPFIATVHHGNETYLYPRGSKYIYVFPNTGNHIETYHQNDDSKKLETYIKNHIIEITKIPVKDYIKEEEKYFVKYIKEKTTKECVRNENQTILGK